MCQLSQLLCSHSLENKGTALKTAPCTESPVVASAQVALNFWLCVKGLGRCKNRMGSESGRTETEAWFECLNIFVSLEHCPRKQSNFQDMVKLANYYRLDTTFNFCENCI